MYSCVPLQVYLCDIAEYIIVLTDFLTSVSNLGISAVIRMPFVC